MPLASTACVLCTRPSKESRHQPQSQPLAASACKGRCTDREPGRGVMPPSAAHMSTPCCDVWGCCMGLGSGAQGTGAPLAAGCCMVRCGSQEGAEMHCHHNSWHWPNNMLVNSNGRVQQDTYICVPMCVLPSSFLGCWAVFHWFLPCCCAAGTGSYLWVVQVVLVHTRLLLRMRSAPCNSAAGQANEHVGPGYARGLPVSSAQPCWCRVTAG